MDVPASLDVVEDAVRRAVDAQDRRADAADTRAGLVLGFSGLVVSLGGGAGRPPFALAARLLAGGAALAALAATGVIVRHRTDVGVLRERYLAHHPARTRLTLLDAEVQLHRAGAARLRRKMARLRLASGLLTVAVAISLYGASVEVLA